MRIYHFNHSTGDYLGQSEADASPAEDGAFLVPAHAATIAPPVFDTTQQTCRWNGSAWIVAAIQPVVAQVITPSAADILAQNNAIQKAAADAQDMASIADMRAFLLAKFGNDQAMPAGLAAKAAAAATHRGNIH